MQIYLAIDDTDTLGAPGSGQLAEILAGKLQQGGLVRSCSNISRHQLFIDDNIPYTSHNSAMCFSADLVDSTLDNIIGYASRFLTSSAAPGSDPGLCIVRDSAELDTAPLINFGKEAKESILTKDHAYKIADRPGIHLSEHGGTGGGVIGALAGIGLRLTGEDGRFRGWLELGSKGTVTNPVELCCHPRVDSVVTENGAVLAMESKVVLSENKLKTIHRNHQEVVVVKPELSTQNLWTPLSPIEIKLF